MRYFPVFFDLAAQTVLVVGGGEEALRKIRLVMKTPARIFIVADQLCAELAVLAKESSQIIWQREDLNFTHFDGVALVYVTIPALAPQAYLWAKARNVLINAVDDATHSNFIVPALVDRDPVVVAIGTEGTAPVLAQGLRARIDALLDPSLGAVARKADSLRALVAAHLPFGHTRRAFWQKFFSSAHAPIDMGNEKDGGDENALHQIRALAEQPPLGHICLILLNGQDHELLSIKAHRYLMEADIIIYDETTSVEVLELARRDAVRLKFTGLNNMVQQIQAQHQAGQQIVTLLSNQHTADLEVLLSGAQLNATRLLPCSVQETKTEHRHEYAAHGIGLDPLPKIDVLAPRYSQNRQVRQDMGDFRLAYSPAPDLASFQCRHAK